MPDTCRWARRGMSGRVSPSCPSTSLGRGRGAVRRHRDGRRRRPIASRPARRPAPRSDVTRPTAGGEERDTRPLQGGDRSARPPPGRAANLICHVLAGARPDPRSASQARPPIPRIGGLVAYSVDRDRRSRRIGRRTPTRSRTSRRAARCPAPRPARRIAGRTGLRRVPVTPRRGPPPTRRLSQEFSGRRGPSPVSRVSTTRCALSSGSIVSGPPAAASWMSA